MKSVIVIIAALALAASAPAWAATPAKPATVKAATAHKANAQSASRHPKRKLLALARLSYRKPAKTEPPSGVTHHMSALRQEQLAQAPSHPGWFKANDRAGWGVSNGKTETMIGLYSRPDRPNLPGPEIYHHEGNGAAGVAVSFKLDN